VGRGGDGPFTGLQHEPGRRAPGHQPHPSLPGRCPEKGPSPPLHATLVPQSGLYVCGDGDREEQQREIGQGEEVGAEGPFAVCFLQQRYREGDEGAAEQH
jgi:hypothetical protein